jgi:hypothetical protein
MKSAPSAATVTAVIVPSVPSDATPSDPCVVGQCTLELLISKFLDVDGQLVEITHIKMVFDTRKTNTCDQNYGSDSPVLNLRGNEEFLRTHLATHGITWE